MPVIVITVLKAIAVPFQWFWFKASLKLKLVILGCLAGLCLLGYILWINHQRSNLEDKLQDANFNRSMVNVDILSNEIANAVEQGKVLSANTNQADANRANADRLDSNAFDGNASTDKFCRRFRCDSSCATWRKDHPEIVCK